MFETFEKRSYESANGGRILKGKNNFGGSGLADVKVNSGAYLKATTTQTKIHCYITINFYLINKCYIRSF